MGEEGKRGDGERWRGRRRRSGWEREEAKLAKLLFPKLIRSNLLENRKLTQGKEPLSMENWFNRMYILFSFVRHLLYLIMGMCT